MKIKATYFSRGGTQDGSPTFLTEPRSEILTLEVGAAFETKKTTKTAKKIMIIHINFPGSGHSSRQSTWTILLNLSATLSMRLVQVCPLY